jgi:hypothetical protein
VTVDTGDRPTLRVNAVFHDIDPEHADRIAAAMVGRAHELANTPELECDVDVSIESVAPLQAGAGDRQAR